MYRSLRMLSVLCLVGLMTSSPAGAEDPKASEREKLPASGKPFATGGDESQEQVQSEIEHVLTTQELHLVSDRDGNRFAACSHATGGWDLWSSPKEVKVIPVASQGVLTFEISGGEIRELVAFSPVTGRWHRIALKKPTTSKCLPIVSQGIACFHVDGNAYAFSPKTGKWDVTPAANPLTVAQRYVSFHDHDRFGLFSDESGRWDVISAGEFDH
ncbi:MAG: hypothetical protein U1D30_17925 [Planctomycetota bacterium]